VNGHDVNLEPKAVTSISYLTTQLLCFGFVRKGIFAFNADVYKVAKSRIKKTWIQLTGLTTESQVKKIGQLSKRVLRTRGLATLLHNPDVSPLDEPTTGLDPNQLHRNSECHQERWERKLLFSSTHIRSRRICDRVIIINNGQIVADKKLANLISENNEQAWKFDYKNRRTTNRKKLKTLLLIKKHNDMTWELTLQPTKTCDPPAF
jgi:ABC-2 type transport system ATP-binding protein